MKTGFALAALLSSVLALSAAPALAAAPAMAAPAPAKCGPMMMTPECWKAAHDAMTAKLPPPPAKMAMAKPAMPAMPAMMKPMWPVCVPAAKGAGHLLDCTVPK